MTEKLPNKTLEFMTLVLAAGGGTRMRSKLPKVMHKLGGTPLISHVLACAAPLGPEKTVLVLAPHMETVQQEATKTAPGCQFAVQEKPLGTGHAVKSALAHFKDYKGVVLVLYGDTPLIATDTLQALLAGHAQHKATISLLGMCPTPPTGYGRLVMREQPYVQRIVECKDATPAEKEIPWVWAGVIAFDAQFLARSLEKLQPSPVTQEYYLTALIEMAAAEQLRTVMVPVSVQEAMGINTRAQLAEAEAALQQRLRAQAMEQGATLIDPASVYLSADTKLGRDVVVHPHVVFGPGVTIADDVEIKSFSHIEGAVVESGATVGPYARLRPGSKVGQGAHVGNFVELKKATLGKDAKANHLSYIGDATVGAGANIGAGTITCNYDGINKYDTNIGENAFIGSNTALVAPVTVGAGAVVGAGSVITQDVPADALAIARGQQANISGRGKQLREKKKA
ncbi:MAG: bifunctional UDP-N-acetylglucosamine diphosphorylase/glucosamine-1-phosphate N-acetyltransferase GlmU [Proteobacteria bacterium]|nr:bifunctional UDP-N-acetylglucosamine diphosphorylase/glucosamine-1-phosphate N-acetyltransferase GlmU [Pseudomonadota bacterium]